jgi:hypothetical protein
MYMCVRNIDVVSVPCEWSCICLSGISMLSLFLVSGHLYVCQDYRCCLFSLWVVMYTSIILTDIYMTTHKEQKQHRYSWHTYTWPLTRHRDYIDIPDRHIHDHSQGTETTSIFLTDLYMTTHKKQRQLLYSWGYVYVCQEYRCCFCSLWVVMYMSIRNIDVVSVPCEWSSICLSGL